MSAQSGVSAQGAYTHGVSAHGGCLRGGVLCQGGCLPGTELLTHACDNITFPQLLLLALIRTVNYHMLLFHWLKLDLSIWSCNQTKLRHPTLLPLTNGVWSKVMFPQTCVIPSVHIGWLPSMHYWSHDQGVCIKGDSASRGLGRPPHPESTGYGQRGQRAAGTHPTGITSF